ncbi:PREDICTED: uncharacterized protein LOC109236449 [Nicotiana attenuata]|uniref:Uncharacterized protein n=1 Tax=Nicotiana attenuata TaxID=49451 RepID=A0A314LGB1_NICAT|nr:PREDICTED: uncharacterized protein LOC109236449 [Nicotiana attenuata]OIT40735.1 hypothetical protein A4A49_11233 [Nicotiana attenuata]
MLGRRLLPIQSPPLPIQNPPLLNQVDGPPPPPPSPPRPPLRALAANVTALIPLEEESTRLQLDIMKLEKRAEDIFNAFTNHISFVLLFTGGGLIFNTRLPCTAIATFTTLTLISFIVGFLMAYRVLWIKTKRMQPAMDTLDGRKNELADRANTIWTSEDARQTAYDLGPLNESTNLLHPQELADTVKMRAKVIMDSAGIAELKKYNCQLIWAILTCLVVHGSVICVTAYYSYGYAKEGCKYPKVI